MRDFNNYKYQRKMERKDVISSVRWCHKGFADKMTGFKADDIETLFAFYEVGGKKAKQVESWPGYCREERASKVLEMAEQSTESAELNFLFTGEKSNKKIIIHCPTLCLPRPGE